MVIINILHNSEMYKRCLNNRWRGQVSSTYEVDVVRLGKFGDGVSIIVFFVVDFYI